MTRLLDDYVIAVSAGVITTAVVVLGALLSRYSKLVDEADKSSRLAKDLWDSVNSRFSVVDGRIIDLMAKTEVLASRMSLPQSAPHTRAVPATQVNLSTKASQPADVPRAPVAPQVSHGESTETELNVLRMLLEGPRNSAQIREGLGKSREHTARMMKILFDRGLVIRNDRNKPYLYEITDVGKSYVAT